MGSGGRVTERKLYNVAVIGAGIAGASAAAELSDDAAVLLLEMENHPGYHSTGRSAAMFVDTYGPAPVRALTRASSSFFDNPPPGFADVPLLTDRGVIMIARKDQLGSLDQLMTDLSDTGKLDLLTTAEIEARLPLLRKGYAAAGFANDRVRDIDVNALHQGYLRMFRSKGGDIKPASEVEALERIAGHWRITTKTGVYKAETVINAAGAWADRIGALAGTASIGLIPKRRTAMIIAAPDDVPSDEWPMAIDIDELFYLKPDAGKLLISPADETAATPSDIQPDELDIAICVDRIEQAFDLSIRRIENKWAGLRSFVADKCPVCGFDQEVPGFFWLAGQGGYGIQTAPALAKVAAHLVRGRAVPPEILEEGVSLADLAPGRDSLTVKPH